MMPVFGIDRDLGRRTEGDLIAGDVIGDVDDGQCPAAGCPLAKIHERSCRLDLAGCDRIQDEAYLALEHATGDSVEGDLGLVPRPDRCKEFCWKAAPSNWSFSSILTKTITGRNGAGTTYMPGRKATWVTNPALGACVTV
jgi:hypothetical protein